MFIIILVKAYSDLDVTPTFAFTKEYNDNNILMNENKCIHPL